MNTITELKQLYLSRQQVDKEMRLKSSISSLPKKLDICYNTIVKEKYPYSHYALELGISAISRLEDTSETALEYTKRNIYGDNGLSNYKLTYYFEDSFYFPLDIKAFFEFQFYYNEVSYLRFNRLFKVLMFLCCHCYRVGSDFYCSIVNIAETLNMDCKTIEGLLDQLIKGGWIMQSSTGNNFKQKPNSYKINECLINYDFFCDTNRKDKYHRDLTNFCFRKEII